MVLWENPRTTEGSAENALNPKREYYKSFHRINKTLCLGVSDYIFCSTVCPNTLF